MSIESGAIQRAYPLVHPDWSFSRIFGDTPDQIENDERRLFYVALTRAVDSLVLVSDASARSPFLTEIMSRQALSTLPWSAFAPVADTADRSLLLKVKDCRGTQFGATGSGTYHIKDVLRASKFQFNGSDKLWERILPQAGFMIESVQKEPWSTIASSVDVLFYNETEDLLAAYRIDRGQWSTVFDHWDKMPPLAVDAQHFVQTAPHQKNSST